MTSPLLRTCLALMIPPFAALSPTRAADGPKRALFNGDSLLYRGGGLRTHVHRIAC